MCLYVDVNPQKIFIMARKSKKQKLIEKIKSIINEWGSFSVGEVEADCSPCVNSMGGLVALAEHFNAENVGIEVYEPTSFSSDSQESYTMTYEELEVDVLEEILTLAEQYEASEYKTFKRCRN